MAASTVVLITGVGRGIAHSVAAAYLLRPNHTVIGTVRDAKSPKSQELKKLPAGTGSRLLLVSIENSSTTDPKKAVEEIEAAGVDHIDVVISSSGANHVPEALDTIDPKILVDLFTVNTVSSVLLFQAVKTLLTKSSNPKWISISTRVGSIAGAAAWYYPLGAYGISKVAQNWFTVTLHHSIESLTAFAVHPGFVSTDMGIASAKAAGMDTPPTTPDESATKLLQLVDSATRNTKSGKFFDVITGEEYPW